MGLGEVGFQRVGGFQAHRDAAGVEVGWVPERGQPGAGVVEVQDVLAAGSLGAGALQVDGASRAFNLP